MRKIASILAILVAILVSTTGGAATTPSSKSDINSSFSHLDANDIGVFNIGLALGGAIRSFDETVEKDILEFEYSLSKESIIGVWTKDYPLYLKADVVDAVKIGVRVPNPNQLQQVSVKLEIKGTKAKQDIPLHLKAGWNYFREAIDWNAIGDFREAVFVVSPMSVGPTGTNPMWFDAVEASPTDSGELLEGILYFDIDFYKLTFLQKNFIFVKIGLIFVISFLTAWVVAILGRFFGREKLQVS